MARLWADLWGRTVDADLHHFCWSDAIVAESTWPSKWAKNQEFAEKYVAKSQFAEDVAHIDRLRIGSRLAHLLAVVQGRHGN